MFMKMCSFFSQNYIGIVALNILGWALYMLIKFTTNNNNSFSSCPMIKTEYGLNMECFSLKNKSVSCDTSLPLDSKATFSCKKYYKPLNDPKYEKEIFCLPNGRWSGQVLKCQAECGMPVKSPEVPLIIHGWNVTVSSWPWHISIYERGIKENEWILTCAATLLTEKSAITAAHCVWKKGPEQFRIAAGKDKRPLEDDSPRVQIRNVESIYIYPLYGDAQGDYGSDIALLAFNESIEYSHFALPVCMNWTFHDFGGGGGPDEMPIGTVAGMGLTAEEKPSEFLQATTLLVVEPKECKKSQNENFRKFVTRTVFCAGWTNGSAVCNGDSGGGLVFPRQQNGVELWTLEGIVSVSPRRENANVCDFTKLTLFTKVGMYVDWVKKILLVVNSKETIFL